MINYNGELRSSDTTLSNSNRAFLYGDGVFETLKIYNSTILFLEDHYFRLMASMRIVRMQIPADFTLEYFESQILSLTNNLAVSDSARVRFTVFRNDGGYYLPQTREVSFVIQASRLEQKDYRCDESPYEVDLYKDFFVPKTLLSTLKTTNKMLSITGSIYAHENGLQNALVLNDEKNVAEALNGSLFMLMGTTLSTPPLSEGCLNGMMRKQLLVLAKKIEGLEVIEKAISPFDLQKADELFVCNIIMGVQPITQYRKKTYATSLSKQLTALLNDLIGN
jgi:branched-chain amino acid aminotransferase